MKNDFEKKKTRKPMAWTWICGGSSPKLPPMPIPRRRRPAAYPSSHGGALGGGPARDGGVVYPSAVPYAAGERGTCSWFSDLSPYCSGRSSLVDPPLQCVVFSCLPACLPV